MKIKMLSLIACFVLLGSMAHAQQWVTVGNYGQGPVTVPAGMWIRYGSVKDNAFVIKWYNNGKSGFNIDFHEYTTNPDPTADQTTFVIQAYVLPLAQTLTVAGATVTVPAYGAPPTTPTTTSGVLTGGMAGAAQVSYTVNLNADKSFNSGSCTVTAVPK